MNKMIWIVVMFVGLVLLWPPKDETETNLFFLQKSAIHGIGMFSKVHRSKGETLLHALSNDKKITKSGKFVNHSWTPNCDLQHFAKRGWWLVANRDVVSGEEITANYSKTPGFIEKPDPIW